MGYGQRTLELLTSYYQGDVTNLEEVEKQLNETDGAKAAEDPTEHEGS